VCHELNLFEPFLPGGLKVLSRAVGDEVCAGARRLLGFDKILDVSGTSFHQAF
jgi:hypothetical protein